MTRPLVSIVTPTLNGGAFLAEAIESVRRQTYERIEHLVVDGGSTDDSVAILEGARREGLRFWSEPDDGQADALVKGFAHAQGDILTWLNADDVYLDDGVVARVVQAFETQPSVDVVAAGGAYIDERGEFVRPIAPPVGLTLERLREVDLLLQPATFFRRPVVDSTGIDRSLHYAFDWDFFVRALAAHRFVVLDERLAGYRLHGGSKTVAGGSRRTWEIAEVTRRNLGARSWQYHTLRAVAAVDRSLDELPSRLEHPLRRLLNGGVLRALRRSTGRRLQT